MNSLSSMGAESAVPRCYVGVRERMEKERKGKSERERERERERKRERERRSQDRKMWEGDNPYS